MILEQLGIYGWKEHDENLVLASFLEVCRAPWLARALALTRHRRTARVRPQGGRHPL